MKAIIHAKLSSMSVFICIHSGRWSDMRAQAMPRGTIVDAHARPRT